MSKSDHNIKETARKMLFEADALGIKQEYFIGAKAIMRRISEGKADPKDFSQLGSFLEYAGTDKALGYAEELFAYATQEQNTPAVLATETPAEKLPKDDRNNVGNSQKQIDSEPDQIPLSKLYGGMFNPRLLVDCDVADLKHNLSKNELIHPIILRRISQLNGLEYEVTVGGRRYIALMEVRGKNGVLYRHEYRIVDWDDAKCIQAALSENAQRHDLSPYEEGHYLNKISKYLEIKSDVELEKLTGITRQNINELRSLDDNFDKLPESWKKALRVPPNCRSSDKAMTVTHFKHIRTLLKGEVTEPVRNMLDKAATEHWSCAKLKDEVDKLAGGSSVPSKKTIPNGDVVCKEGKKTVQTEQPADEEDSEDEPEDDASDDELGDDPDDDREAIIENLKQVAGKCKQYTSLAPIAKRIQDIIKDLKNIEMINAA